MAEGPLLAEGFAPGKLILSGEHAVVRGHLAIALAVSRGTTVQLRAHAGPTHIAASTIQDGRLAQAIAAMLPPTGLSVHITTDLPVGRGMGSSAALAVALVRARAGLEGRTASAEECIEQGFVAERIFHGSPSGVDHTVSSLGGGVRYRRGQPVVPFTPPPLTLVVMDTGIAGDTAQLVAGVGALPDVDARLAHIGEITQAISAHLSLPDPELPTLGGLLTENHRRLQAIGVSTPLLDALVAASLDAGAWGAKLAGAGGGGVAFALTDTPAPVIAAAARLSCPAFVLNFPAQ